MEDNHIDVKQKQTGVTGTGSPWVLLDKNLQASKKTEDFNTIHQQSTDCIEIHNGLNTLKEGFLGGFFSTVFLIFIAWMIFPAWEIFIGLVAFIVFTILPFLIFGRRLYSNTRLNRKTQKLYAIDKNTDQLIEMDWADVEVRQFTNARTSGRGVSADYNLDFHGKDKHSGVNISITTPMITTEERSLSHWEFLREFMNGVPMDELMRKEVEEEQDSNLNDEDGGVDLFATKDYPVGKTTKERITIYIDKWFYGKGFRPLKELWKGIFLALKSFAIHWGFFNALLMIIPILNLLMSIFGLPGVAFESWVYFNLKHHPKFPKEIDELCGFKENTSPPTL